MKRILFGGAVAAALFTVGTPALASAATTRPVTRTITVTHTSTASTAAMCKLSLATQIPANDTSVLAGTDSGKQSGKSACNAALGSGITHTSFDTNDAGNLFGKVQQWFNTGTVYGEYFLKAQPNNGPPTSTSFASASYAGTVTIKGGHGALYGATGRGTMSCTSNDSAHFSCTEKVSLSIPSAQGSSS